MIIEDERGGLISFYTNDTVLYQINDNGDPVYMGRAKPGSLASSPCWQIRKFSYSGISLISIQWASGTAIYDKVWDDRATYTYS